MLSVVQMNDSMKPKTKETAKQGIRNSSWDRDVSLAARQAMTRDGRLVINLREAIIDDGETVLFGEVSRKPLARYKPGDIINTEKHWWPGRGAWGNHGGDDLVTSKI
jgi:hypothetical protein